MPLCNDSVEYLLSSYFIPFSPKHSELCSSLMKDILYPIVDVAFCFLAAQTSLPRHTLLLLVLSWYCPTRQNLTNPHNIVIRGNRENHVRGYFACFAIMQCKCWASPRELCKCISNIISLIILAQCEIKDGPWAKKSLDGWFVYYS